MVVMNEGIIVDVGTYEELLERGVDIHSMVAADDDDEGKDGAGELTAATPLGAKSAVALSGMDGVVNGAAVEANGHGAAANGNGVAATVVARVEAAMNGGGSASSSAGGSGAATPGAGAKGEGGVGKLAAALAAAGPGAGGGASLRRQHTGLTSVERQKLLRSLTMQEKDGKIVKVGGERRVGWGE